MRYKRFDVVELNNGNKATILSIEGNKYFAEIVNDKGKTIDNTYILESEIKSVIFKK